MRLPASERYSTSHVASQTFSAKSLEQERISKFASLEKKKLSEDIPYDQISGLRLEARQKLMQRKPMSLGQASRISGVSPADISVLLVYLEAKKREEKKDQESRKDG